MRDQNANSRSVLPRRGLCASTEHARSTKGLEGYVGLRMNDGGAEDDNDLKGDGDDEDEDDNDNKGSGDAVSGDGPGGAPRG